MNYQRQLYKVGVIGILIVLLLSLTACNTGKSGTNTGAQSKIPSEATAAIGKTYNQLKEEYPNYTTVDAEGEETYASFYDAAFPFLGSPDAEYNFVFYGTQDGPPLVDVAEYYGNELRCIGVTGEVGDLFPEMKEDMSFEDFFAWLEVDDYTYNDWDVLDGPGGEALTFEYKDFNIDIEALGSLKTKILKKDYPVLITKGDMLQNDEYLQKTWEKLYSTAVEGNSNANIQNYGPMAFDGENIYYSLPITDLDEDGLLKYGIFESSLDGTSDNQIAETDEDLMFLNLYDGKLYGTSYGGNVIAIDLITGETNVIMEDYAYRMRILDGRIYYASEWTIYSCDLDGNDRKEIVTVPSHIWNLDFGISDLAVDNGKVYYIALSQEWEPEYPQAEEDPLVYTYEKVYSKQIEGGEDSETLIYEAEKDDSIDNIQVNGNDVYFIVSHWYDGEEKVTLYCNGKPVENNGTSLTNGFGIETNVYFVDNDDIYTINQYEDSTISIFRNGEKIKTLENSKGLIGPNTFNISENSFYWYDGSAVIESMDLDTLEVKTVIDKTN
jgi:hypothetical protein